MKYINYIKHSILDGSGFRNVLFISGCPFRCKGCHNELSWDSKKGKDVTQKFVNQIILDLKNPIVKGITLSGGDPMFKPHRPEILDLVTKIKKECPNKTIWMYTGYTLEQIENDPILKFIDVLIDGKFEENLKDPNLAFRGSSNQRIIYLNK